MSVQETFIDFLEVIAEDNRIGLSHLSVYMALLYYKGSNEQITIRRINIMRMAKINARHTYHKCMKQLQQFGYIHYSPSSNAAIGSVVRFRKLR